MVQSCLTELPDGAVFLDGRLTELLDGAVLLDGVGLADGFVFEGGRSWAHLAVFHRDRCRTDGRGSGFCPTIRFSFWSFPSSPGHRLLITVRFFIESIIRVNGSPVQVGTPLEPLYRIN